MNTLETSSDSLTTAIALWPSDLGLLASAGCLSVKRYSALPPAVLGVSVKMASREKGEEDEPTPRYPCTMM